MCVCFWAGIITVEEVYFDEHYKLGHLRLEIQKHTRDLGKT